MSKSIIALVITWILIGLIGAFSGGYFWAKKNACSLNNQNTENVGSVPAVNSTSNSPKFNPTTSNDSNKTTDQTNGAASDPISGDANKTIVKPTGQK